LQGSDTLLQPIGKDPVEVCQTHSPRHISIEWHHDEKKRDARA